MYPSRSILIGLLIGTSILRPVTSAGVSTLLWGVQTQEQFRQGEPKDVSLTPDGEVVLAPPLELLSSTGELYCWSLAKDQRGNIYVGTGNEGKVFKMARGEASLHFDPPGTEIYSLAVDRQGDLYVGSSPEGIVYKVTPDGRSSQFFKADEKYIWSMVFDKRGNLYIGCGEKGKIYSIDQGGKGRLLYDSEERHVLSLLLDEGKLYAGTEGTGLVYEITPQGKARGIFDPPEEEVRTLVLDASGDLYLGAVKGEALPKEEKKKEKSSPPVESISDRGKKSTIYRVSPEGIFTEVWSSSSHQALSLCLDRGNILAGTGDEGQVYLINPVKGGTELFQCEDSQILSLLRDGERIYLGTGNMGKVYRLGRGYRRKGELVSRVKDTETISRWGRISWIGETPFGTKISLQTRTGNTNEVDKTWSGWSRQYSNGDPIDSPPARFIQWRATLSTSDQNLSPVLSMVQVAWLPQNLPPTITSLSVLPPGVGAGAGDILKTSPLPYEARKAIRERGISLPDQVYKLERGLRSVWWTAEDPNGDPLLYTVYFKGIRERDWKVLKEDVESTNYTFDSFSLPDGCYRIRVVASDLRANPKETALSTERMSDKFIVDNFPPEVESPRVNPERAEVKVKAEDSLSVLAGCEYSIDGGEWRGLFPTDGVFDSKAEEFEFKIEGLPRGEHTIAIRVIEQSLNVGSSKRVFYVK